jgi:hypothetical protein
MDIKRLLNNRNINEDLSLQEPGLSHNVREFGPYQVRTDIQRLSDGYGLMGNKLIHSIDLPENQQPDEEMANRIAKELAIDPSIVLDIKPGENWIKGNTSYQETMGNSDMIDDKRFKRIGNMLKK